MKFHKNFFTVTKIILRTSTLSYTQTPQFNTRTTPFQHPKSVSSTSPTAQPPSVQHSSQFHNPSLKHKKSFRSTYWWFFGVGLRGFGCGTEEFWGLKGGPFVLDWGGHLRAYSLYWELADQSPFNFCDFLRLSRKKILLPW